MFSFQRSLVFAACTLGLTYCQAAEKNLSANPLYFPLDAPAGTSRAVIAQGLSLVHTRQLLPLDRDGKLVGEGSANQQIQQVLANLKAVLNQSGSSMNKLVRLNVYALSPSSIARFQEQLTQQLDPAVRPVITSILTPLPHRQALIAADAVAAADSEKGPVVKRLRCSEVAGNDQYADAAVLPAGGVAYLSGRTGEAGLTTSAVTQAMTVLLKNLDELKLSSADVVQLKVFLKPAEMANDVLRELQKFFPEDQKLPPVLFVEWLTTIPTEIEMIARLPIKKNTARGIAYFNPSGDPPSPSFSRVSLVTTDRQIYISGLFGPKPPNPNKCDDEASDMFSQLQKILDATGSDSRHLVKASYYVTTDAAGRSFDRARAKFLVDQRRTPAASKVTVHGVGQAGRTMTFDMIAVDKESP